MEEWGWKHRDGGAGTEVWGCGHGDGGAEQVPGELWWCSGCACWAALLAGLVEGWCRGGGCCAWGWPAPQACQAGVMGAGGQCRVRECAGDPCRGLLCPLGTASHAQATLDSGTDSCTVRPSWVLRLPVRGLCQPDHSRTAPKDARRLGRNKSSLCFLFGIDLRFRKEQSSLGGTLLLRLQPRWESGQGQRKTCEFAGRSHF